ncbi:phage late control D family protein [Klebsiella aerogenes]|uniref:phage late control D family protein n=1 Tax=Klebsiella aerogenes TaxID=548 RepID=UPI00063C87FD|nr:phage late control D family protein [Klebsiella aerogenes]KLE94938.1 hypothetical protein YA22_08155 [Klebsiella aerogenes]KUQ08292.1 hypothetical protein AWI08_13830 [Klebsiella aerogenes]MEA8782961.1 phage late control D family protein [Klebsiella aerogenes]VAG18120.1 VgrG protein [Klebsiella aerogenes]
MTEQTKIIQLQDTLNRYLLYFPRSKSTAVDVHSFIGEETLSKPYRYTIRFTSADDNIPAGAVLNQIARFYLRAPNPNARWQNEAAWVPVRQINGVITQFTRLKSSSDEALYECVLEHELALLDKNYRSAVYTDVTVPEVVTQLMKNSGYFKGYNIDFDKLSYTYPRREMIIQWKETDLQFIRRLLAEIGIWFRFENHHKVQTEIGQCKSFDYKAGKFWESLLHRADWRDPLNEFPAAKEYYRTGKLPEIPTKFHMNKPDKVLPQGDYGVVNDYAGKRPQTRRPKDIDMGIVRTKDFQEIKFLQWEMPKPKSDGQLA